MRQKTQADAAVASLEALLDETAAGLAQLSVQRLFGCKALFAGKKMFALVWKTGRVGLKFADDATYAELLAMRGAEPWQPMGAAMKAWVLVPAEMHEARALRPWLERAHAAAIADKREKKPAKARAPRKKKTEA